jgi:isopentenyl-diphosphate Delta-isomerase
MDVILVDEQDRQTGVMEKMEAHQKALLHRAFSVFIFNSRNELLLQKRADGKYHSAGLWTNACCSHPQPGEDTLSAAEKRLQEEMGFTVPLTEVFSFVYKAPFENGLTEYEYDHVLVGSFDGEVKPNTSEASDYCYKTFADIKASLQSHPGHFTAWFKIAFPKLEAYLAATSF